MKRPVLVMTDPLFPQVVKATVGRKAKIIVARTARELDRALPQADALMTLLSVKVDAPLLAKAPQLKVVGNYAVGVNNIDLNACRKRGVKVVNTPDVLTHSTAELTLALLLACARRFREGMSLCESNRFTGWTPTYLLGTDLRGRTAVIVGPGRIGKATARLFEAVGLQVEWIDRSTSTAKIRRILGQADVLSLHLPLSKDSFHWLDATRLQYLKKGCIVLNTSRGPLIEEKALALALKQGRVGAIGLDVFEHEPQIHTALCTHPRAVLVPHIGSATERTRHEMAATVLRGIVSELAGRRAPNRVR